MDMTNEEKAKQIFCEYCLNEGWNKCRETCSGYMVGVLKLQEMADWKDEQAKIAIEKAKAEAQLEILNWMKDEVATYHVKDQVMRKRRYLTKKLKKLNEQ